MCGAIAHRIVTARFNVVCLFAYFVALNALCHQLLGNISGLRWELICSQSSSRLRLDFDPTSCLILFLGLPIRSPYIYIYIYIYTYIYIYIYIYLSTYFPISFIRPCSLMDKALASKSEGREYKRPAFADFANSAHISSKLRHKCHTAQPHCTQPHCTTTLHSDIAQIHCTMAGTIPGGGRDHRTSNLQSPAPEADVLSLRPCELMASSAKPMIGFGVSKKTAKHGRDTPETQPRQGPRRVCTGFTQGLRKFYPRSTLGLH